MHHASSAPCGVPSPQHSIQPQPGKGAALIITAEGRLFTPDGSHSLGTCGTAERAIEFCRRTDWGWIVRDVQPTQGLAGAGEGVAL